MNGKINPIKPLHGAVANSGSGTYDHSRLINRDLANQHPIESITGLRDVLLQKLDEKTALILIEDAVKNKAQGLYYDEKTGGWYLTSEIDPDTKMGTAESIISGPYELGKKAEYDEEEETLLLF